MLPTVSPYDGEPPTGEPDAGDPHVRFGGRGKPRLLPTPIVERLCVSVSRWLVQINTSAQLRNSVISAWFLLPPRSQAVEGPTTKDRGRTRVQEPGTKDHR